MDKTRITNPFKQWLMRQPRDMTQVRISRELGVNQSYVSDMMSETSRVVPSLALALKIEDMTGGKVTPRKIFEFALANRRADEREAA